MSRRSRRDDEQDFGDRPWPPGGHGTPGQAGDPGGGRPPGPGYRRGRSGTRTSGDSGTGPPWDAASRPWDGPGWDDTSGSLPRTDPADLTGGHPSGPLPPLPAHDTGWPEPPAAFGYGDDPGDEHGYPGYPAGGEETGAYPGRGPAGGGYPETGDNAGYGYAGYGDAGYQGGGYPAGDYPTGYHEADRGYPVAGGGYADTGTGHRIPAYHDDGYPGDPHEAGYPGDDDAYPGYGDPDWYGDPGDERAWAGHEDDDGEGFLPGLGSGRRGRSGRDGDYRTPRGGRQGNGGKRKRGMRRVAPWLALAVLVILLAGVGTVGLYYYRTYVSPPDYSGPGTGSVVVAIHKGDTATVVGQRLQQLGVVASARAFANAAKSSGQGTALEPGLYRVHRHMQASLAFALLLKPSARVETKITIPEGKRLSQIIQILGTATGNLRGYQQAIKNVPALNLPAFAHGNPEGYLFPATYTIQPNTAPIKVLQQMVTAFDAEAASVSLPSAAAHAFLTQSDVITVASLIQAEGRRLQDFPKIARVIYNRLNATPQMPLQLDSTVMYALHTFGIRASNAQIKVNSPYNTYRHTGLPPGPIDSPGDAAIRAALHPAQGDWLYFVTVDPKTGLTKFTNSYAQFQQFEAQLSANLGKGR